MAENNQNPPNERNNSENFSLEELTEFTALIKQGFEALMPTIRASNSLPKGQQWDLFCTSPLFKPIMDSLGNRALELMALILQHQGLHRDIRKRDLEEKYELIVEANDKILERVSTHLDELSGVRRNPSQSVSNVLISSISSGSWNRDIAKSAAWKEVKLTKTPETPIVLRNARVTQRPQVKFMDKIDNSSTPFEPRIKEKPNALKPLAILFEALPNADPCYSHPYEFELDRFQERIESLNLVPRKPQYPKPVEETQLMMVTQEAQLLEMLQDLRSQTEIAVDLEHHSYRSFQGFTCLMQISTREKDYIVDTLDLRHKLYILNEVFTHPKIVKVFHGAESDVLWLQRDLSLYIVNMFDTYQAALLLSLPRLSLAFLLKSFCNIDANKHFQLYDWRTRPLAKEAIKYAREDTHYLLYIYDMLWNKLIEKSNCGTQLLQSVIFRSTDTCKRRYWKFIFKEDSYESMYRQSRKNFDNRQIYALQELYAWRDRTAREEDESAGYVLPNHMLLLIAEKLPKEMQGILACCNPIPPLVRQNLVLLHQIILKAREQPLVAKVTTGLSNETRIRPTLQTSINLESTLHCPHDLTHNVDFRDDLPTLINSPRVDVECNNDLVENKSILPIFGNDENEDSNLTKLDFPSQTYFLSPFERYKRMLLYVESEDKKSKEDKEREIARDTQKLLDECMKERLKMAAAKSTEYTNFSGETIAIKEENQGHRRKRGHSPSSSEGNPGDVSIKSEISYEESPGQPKMTGSQHLCEEFKSQVFNSTPEEVIKQKIEKGLKVENDCTPKRKKPKKNSKCVSINEVTPLKVGLKKEDFNNISQNKNNSSASFSQYDYSEVDYSQFQQAEVKPIAKSSQDKFKHKGKKKQQNKTFTFARQFGSGSARK